ncbi:pyridoxamine 5'-phosphate oxidase family protein [Desulfosarcina sp.]|uniref:pyridoxamine 5'-phosphate oxidase family protein n=1 Tax=Desulfosarcina sp. TaxID=2027861 RepID=UPI003568DEBB
MRRIDKAVSDASGINAIIQKATVCRLGMVEANRPYIVPLSFGFQDNTLYFHGALKGRKMDILRDNPNVCVEFDISVEALKDADACNWSMRFQSVIGFGKATLVEGLEPKRQALGIIMAHYSDKTFAFPEKKINATAVIKVEIEKMTGKQSGF